MKSIDKIYNMLYIYYTCLGDDMNEFKEIGILIKRLSNNIDKNKNMFFSKYNLTGNQCEILIYLLHNQDIDIYQKDIEKEFNQSNPVVTGILNRLESSGYIKRIISDKDLRCRKICLTDKTYELKSNIEGELIEFNKTFNCTLTEIELKELKRLLEKLYTNQD